MDTDAAFFSFELRGSCDSLAVLLFVLLLLALIWLLPSLTFETAAPVSVGFFVRLLDLFLDFETVIECLEWRVTVLLCW